jgi:LPS-assembly protein
MKSKLLILFLFLIFFSPHAKTENLLIESKKITIDKKSEISIFENDVLVTTQDNDKIKSDYVEYNQKIGFLVLKNNVVAIDSENNIIETNYAEYNEKEKILKTRGPTKITTTEKYVINSEDIIADKNKKFIKSQKNTIITDNENNKIFLEQFEYQNTNNIFKSVGYIKIEDKMNNSYEFSQIYIDTKKKEILGADSKSYINNKDLKYDIRNKPRIFSNSAKISKDNSVFEKSVFTICDYRKNDKCPPWKIQAKKMLHDNIKKTVYYDHAVVKVYNIPIFYFPKLNHPDPTVDRRSGFLPPIISNSKNLSTGISVPYFWAINDDKNLTITNKIFASENPLTYGEYHQALKDASLKADFGYTKGYKKITDKKKSGDKSHFFTKYSKIFNSEKSKNSLDLTLQQVSDDKYLKLYKINSNLVNQDTLTLQNKLEFTHKNDDIYFNFQSSALETLKDTYNDKFSYVLPDVTISKNLFNNVKMGSLDVESNFKSERYSTNILENFFTTDFNWNSINKVFRSGVNSRILTNVRNINYEVKNYENESYDIYKKDTISEFHGAIGLLTEINLEKKVNNFYQYLTPKILLRFAPGNMRKEQDGSKLDPGKAFSMDRLSSNKNYEEGLSGTIGFDYNLKDGEKKFDFSIAQVINEMENSKMHQRSSMDEKLSDLVGSASYTLNKNLKFDYKFNADQNYKELNYSEIGAEFNLNRLKVDFDYLQENKHIGIDGNQEYFKTKINYEKSEKTSFSFENKRSLLTNSSEFYNMSYEYHNDCLRAGLVYRREFYNDSELDSENSLMFKVTLTPFGDIDSPSFGK